MILRYYETDWSIPCIENELLFVGTKEECIQYLYKHWSVDCKELENNIELQATFCDYLRHIEYSHRMFEERTVDEILEHHPDWCNTEWHHIDSHKFIFNRELVEIIEPKLLGSDFDIDTYRIMEESTMNLEDF